MAKKLLHNPFVFFLPFLFVYAYNIVINKWPKLYGDEIRYADFAWAILHGYYSPPPPHINLWNGPGYPLVIVPFMALHVRALYITLLNAVFAYLAVVLLYKSLRLLTNFTTALVCALLLGLYPNTFAILPILYTEAFTLFLVSALVYSATRCYLRPNIKRIMLTGFVLGYLTLTKVIFGYVLTAGLVLFLIFAIFKSNRKHYLRQAYILLIAFIITLPWLFYTYHITHKAFYWGDSGGMSLYWMSSPYDNEYGDWKLPQLNNRQYPISFQSAETVAILKKNHSKEISYILSKNELQQDELFKQAAWRNIRQHPGKFMQNYYYNWSRMLFNFPYSYSYQDSAIIGNILRGSLILWVSILGLFITVINWRVVLWPVKFTMLLTCIYLLLSGMLSAYPRQFDVILPVILLWLGYLAANIKPMSLKFAQDPVATKSKT